MHRPHGPAFILLAASALMAKPPDSYPFGWLRVQGGALVESNAKDIKGAAGYGAGFGLWFNRGAGLELDAVSARLKDKGNLWQANETHVDLALLFAPPALDGPWKPYLRLGAGASKLDRPLALVPRASTRANYVAGLGLQGFLGAHGLFTLEARGTSVRSSTPRTEMQYLVGLGLRWGAGAGTAAAPEGAGGDLSTPRPAIQRVEPAPGPAPTVQPAEPGANPAVQAAPPDDRPAVRKVEP